MAEHSARRALAAPALRLRATQVVRSTRRLVSLTLLVLTVSSGRAAAQAAPELPAPEPRALEPAPEAAAPSVPVAPPVTTQPLPAAAHSEPGDEANPVHVKLVEERRPEPLTKQLVKYGVSFGVAAALLTPLGGGKADQVTAAVTAMPYVVLVPTYFWLSAPRREYCAARALGISRSTAHAATNSYAHALAAEAFAEQRASGLGPYALTEEARRAPSFNQLSSGEQEGLISAYTGWNAGEADKSCHTWWGVYAGFPLNYQANFEDERGARSVRTRGSFGLALLPLGFLHVLVGVTSIAARQTRYDGRFEHAWQFTLSLGVSLDVFAPLFKSPAY